MSAVERYGTVLNISDKPEYGCLLKTARLRLFCLLS